MVGADVLKFRNSGLIISDHSRGDFAALFAQLSARCTVITAAHIRELAERYTAAWGSQKAGALRHSIPSTVACA
jgi:hypothetical protein